MIFDGPEDAPTVVLAHGAGAPMDSPFLSDDGPGLAAGGIRVARFEFPYMRRRRETGERRPPDREPVLREAWQAPIAALGGGERLVIGGKSMGGRMASLVADEAASAAWSASATPSIRRASRSSCARPISATCAPRP